MQSVVAKNALTQTSLPNMVLSERERDTHTHAHAHANAYRQSDRHTDSQRDTQIETYTNRLRKSEG